MSSSVATAYNKDYLLNLFSSRVWFDFIDWQDPVGGSLRGSTLQQPVLEELAPAIAALSETGDADIVALDDDKVDITVYEYGNVVQVTRFLKVVAYTSIEKAAAKAVGQNQGRSIDWLIRSVACGGTLSVMPTGCVARSDLDTSNDLFDYEEATILAAQAASMGIPPFEDDSYVAIVHPLLLKDIQNSSEWKAVGEYSDPKLIYSGRPGQIYGGARFKGEVGSLAGIRFIRHRLGRIALGEGTVAQAATTLTASPSAGDTSIEVTAATGLAAGDWITINAGGATAEQVLITGVDGTTLTIRGAGNKFSNFGLMYDHVHTPVAEKVVEAANVAVVPILGPQSIRGRFASEVGKNGEVRISEAAKNLPGRFINHSWYWLGGFARMEKYLLRGEYAVTGSMYGDNLVGGVAQ
jgi:N4-gp56 family major capsid protein